MKKMTLTGLLFALLLFVGVNSSMAQSNKAINMFKNHINKVVQKVEKAKTPKKKRAIMNSSFNDLLTAFNRVEGMRVLSDNDQAAVHELAGNITARKNELNGTNGFERVPDRQLNSYAHYVQQNIEQANGTITIGIGVAILIVILLILVL